MLIIFKKVAILKSLTYNKKMTDLRLSHIESISNWQISKVKQRLACLPQRWVTALAVCVLENCKTRRQLTWHNS